MDRKLLLLGLLRRQEMHGYQLHEFIDQNLALCTDLKKPTAYYLLDKMDADGWLITETEQEGNRPPRRIYRLTPKGEEAFQRLLRENLAHYDPVNFPGDMGLAFLDSLDADEALTLLTQQKQELETRLQEIQDVPVHQGSLQLVFSHQKRHLQAELDWLADVIAGIEQKQTS
ncbi:MAG: PadR family transcriptional regulator [Anaerolineales bacterium]|jgi:DNA-binding PadR family transcriptional regulator